MAEFESSISYGLERLGYTDTNFFLKPEQKAAVQHLYNGRDVFVWLPTGFWKSLCYEILPFVHDHSKRGCSDKSLVIVVSPLVSLMIDQTQCLRKKGVQAVILSTAASKVDKTLLATDDDLSTCSLLFCAPEAIMCSKWREDLQRPTVMNRVVAVTIDEAHCVSKWSRDFRPSYGRLSELRAIVPKDTPYLACTATVTRKVREEVVRNLEMLDCEFVCASPDRPNISYQVSRRGDMENDMAQIVTCLKNDQRSSPRVIVYCRSLDMCANLYSHFLFELGKKSYFPLGADEVCSNRLFGMFHAHTPQHNKNVIMKSLAKPDGVVRVVFATVAIGMGVDLRDVNTIIHYGAPHSIDDYFQESGRGGRSGQPAKSIVYWSPVDCPNRKQLSSTRDHEVAAVRKYLVNTSVCRRQLLLQHFDSSCKSHDENSDVCCDVCSALDATN